MAAPHEIELKLEFDPGDLERVSRRISAVAGTPFDIAKRLKSTYFDTRNQSLRRRGLSLRVRQDGGENRQTLKSDRHGLFDRRQWECPLTADQPDPDLFKKKPRKLINGSDLQPVFTTDIRRTVWHVERGASHIEIALDEGEVRSGETIGALAELELELISGEQAALFDLAQLLAKDTALRVGVRSKSERGYALGRPAARAAKAEDIDLDPNVSAGAAFQAIARACLRQFRLNEATLLATRDPDSLHQARVAIRRLRSALSIFKDVVADEAFETIRQRLKDTAVTLGNARNLDVYRADLFAPLKANGDGKALQSYHARIDAARDAAYAQVFRTLNAVDFRAFVLSLAAWIETGAWRTRLENAEARERPVDKFARRELRRRTRGVLKKGRDLDTLDAEARHRVRIAAKKLRYAAEFFTSLVPDRKAQRRHRAFVQKLEHLQDALGAVNDIHTGRDVARDVVDAAPPNVTEAFTIGDPPGDHDAREQELIATAAEAFARFRDKAA